ncbi:MAG: hypothetical protein V4819_19900 [Verrucomicrobiota bacterium]
MDKANEPAADSQVSVDPLAATISHWVAFIDNWYIGEPFSDYVQLTRSFLAHFLRPTWLRTDAVMAHARLFLLDNPESDLTDELPGILPASLDRSRKEFLCIVMLDFCDADPSLDDLVIAAGIQQARELGSLQFFEYLVDRWMELHPGHMKLLKSNAARMLAEMDSYPSMPPASTLDLMPPPPPPWAMRISWSPPATPHGGYPEGRDRGDESENDEETFESPEAEDPSNASIHHWARLASRWSKADPSLAKLFAKPGWVRPIRLYLRQFLRIKQLRTDAVMAHARLYFTDFADAEVIYSQPSDLPATSSKLQKEFLCRLMLDFIWVDPAVCDLMIGVSVEQARESGCLRRFEQLMVQERKVPPAVLKCMKAQAARILAEAQSNGCIPLV